MNKFSIWLASLFCLVFIVSNVAAFSGSGAGTMYDTYQVTNYTNLNEMRDEPAAYYSLMNDVDCSGQNWVPFDFSGEFSGQNYHIKNLYVNHTGETYFTGSAFFSTLTGAIDGVMFDDPVIINNGNSGQVMVAVVAGYSSGTSSKIQNLAIYNGTLIATGTDQPIQYMAGITTPYQTELFRVYVIDLHMISAINTTGRTNYMVGGVAAPSSTTMDHCFIAGVFADYPITNSDASVYIMSDGTPTSTYDSFYDDENTDISSGGFGTNLSTAEMTDYLTFAEIDIPLTSENMTDIHGRYHGYPLLVEFIWLQGSGTIGSPYRVYNYDDLNALHRTLYQQEYVSLQNDIECSGNTWAAINNFAPAILNGEGFSINNFTVTEQFFQQNVGFYSLLEDISVTAFTNITFMNPTVTNTYPDETNDAVLIGKTDGTINRNIIDRVFIYGASVTGYAAGGYHGVFVGAMRGGANIKDSAAYNSEISPDGSSGTGAMTGSIYGDVEDITRCWSNLSVKSIIAVRGGTTTVSGSYWDSGFGTSGYGGTSTSTANMKDEGTYSGWNFTHIWRMSNVTGQFAGYPVFKWMSDPGTPPAGDPPVASFTVDHASGNATLTVEFTDTSTESPTYWLWNFGDGNSSSLQNPTHDYTYAGTFYANLYVENAYGNDLSSNTEITVNPAPVVNPPTNAHYHVNVTSGTHSNPVDVRFTPDWSGGDPTSYDWYVNGVHSTSALQHIHFANAGTFNVNLTLANDDGYDTFNGTYVVLSGNPPYAVNWSANVTSGVGQVPPSLPVEFTAHYSGGAPTSYSWYISGFHSTDAQPIATFGSSGVFPVNVTLTNADGSASFNGSYTVLGKAPFILSVGTSKMSGSELAPTSNITFTATFETSTHGVPTAISWVWGDGTPAGTTNSAYHTYTSAGTFNFTVTASNAWGNDSRTYQYVVPVSTVSTVRWTNDVGTTITSAYIGDSVSFMFDTNNVGTNPPAGYIADFFSVEFYKKDISTGNWITDPTVRHFYAMSPGFNTSLVLKDSPFAAGGIYSWKGYTTFTTTGEEQIRGRLVAHNVTNPTLYPPVILGTSDISIVKNPMLVSNVGGWANDLGGSALKLIFALIIVVGMVAAPYIITREFNTYIEIFMAVLGIGIGFFAGLIEIWIVVGLVVVAGIVIFFMNRGSSDTGSSGDTGGEVG